MSIPAEAVEGLKTCINTGTAGEENAEEQYEKSSAPQYFSSPAGPVFIQVFSPSTASAGLDIHVLLVRRSCLP